MALSPRPSHGGHGRLSLLASKVKLLRRAHLRDRGGKQERAPWPPACQCGASAAGSPQPCPDSASRGFLV